uniref:Uncharacterized protein n=1 Tax=Erpetoichthys calabaricus TaxID=27687 RepID=A0A8C4RWI3_ERPCA
SGIQSAPKRTNYCLTRADTLIKWQCESILGLINETVTFQLKVDEIPKGITWKFNEDKVCEIDSTGDVCFSYYKGRANINKTNGFLTISNLVNSDAGKYTAEIHQPTVKEFIFQLEVLGEYFLLLLLLIKQNDTLYWLKILQYGNIRGNSGPFFRQDVIIMFTSCLKKGLELPFESLHIFIFLVSL